MDIPTPETITVEKLADPAVIADPYPFYAALRDASPLYGYSDYPPGTVPGEDDPPTAWAVLKHEQVVEVARQADVFSSRDPLQEASGAPTLMLVNHDDPEHKSLRDCVQPFFTTSAVAPHGEWLASVCDDFVSAMIDKEVDVMQGVAADLPAMVMARILGMPHEDYPKFRQWATAFMLSAPMTPEERGASNQAMFEYFISKVGERAAAGSSEGDFIGTLLQKLSPEEVIRFCFTLLVAGAETTTGLIGNLFWQASLRPALFDQVIEDEDLVAPFIEETLRICGPPQRLFRVATRQTELGGKVINEGDWVAIFFAAANHDPLVWENPTEFRLDRQGARAHFTFGHGIHQCLGAMLVRLEARAVINALRKRRIEVTACPGEDVRQTATQLSYTFEKFVVSLTARS